MSLRQEIERAINRVSAENVSNTPDWILAAYLMNCLSAFDSAVNERDKWYGRESKDERKTSIEPTQNPPPRSANGLEPQGGPL